MYTYNINSIRVCLTTSMYQEAYPNYLIVGGGHYPSAQVNNPVSPLSLAKYSALVQTTNISVSNVL